MTRRTFRGYSSRKGQTDRSQGGFRQRLSETIEESRFPAIVVAGVLGLGTLLAA